MFSPVRTVVSRLIDHFKSKSRSKIFEHEDHILKNIQKADPMSAKIIECIYEGGVLRPLVKVDLEEGKKVQLFLRDERDEILDKYAGIVKLGRKVELSEILALGEDRWQ
jgi:predicted DNA-binding antitoxin AbrB/MazE fold protein